MSSYDIVFFVRNIWRNKLYSFITVSGFAVALTFVILLSVYIRQELAVDAFHVNKDRIFCLTNEFGYGYSGPIGPMLQERFPEVECFTRFMLKNDELARISDSEKVRFSMAYVDPAFFKMFSFPLIEGDVNSVMHERYSMVVSRSFAHKLFGNESPVGNEVMIGNGMRIPVTGVMEDIPEDTHFRKMDAVVNIAGLTGYWNWKNDGDVLDQIGMCTFGLYLMEKSGMDLKAKEGDILACFKKDFPMYQKEGAPQKAVLEPLEKIYFSPYGGGMGKHNSESLIWTLGTIVAVVLLLAVINYINLSVAQGGMRAKEMSIKTLLGSSRKRLFLQFIGESVILCFIAFLLACVIGGLVGPVFNYLMATDIHVADALSVGMLASGCMLILMVGLVSGFIPALIVTRFNPVEVMKGAFRKKTRGTYSKVMICFQYVIAITLIVCTLVLLKQTHYMQHYDMGFRSDCIARFSYVLDAGQKEVLRNEVMKQSGVKNVAFVCGDPVDGGNNYTFEYEGGELSFRTFTVDTSFFSMLGIEVVPTGLVNTEGKEYIQWSMRNGKAEQTRLREQSVWLNKEALKQLGLEGLPVEFKLKKGVQSVRGIVNDFHIHDLSQSLDPLMITPLQSSETPWTMLVQLQGTEQLAAFHAVENAYKKLSSGVPFESDFMNDEIAQWYDRTERMAGMIGGLCLLAVVLSAMGILAMATYFVRQRVKEIGVRRVNGAMIGEILRMLMNSFMKWVVLAFVFACPLGYYIMNRWLSDYAYRTDINGWIFAASGALALLVAGTMICWQSWKAATVNPVKALKNE